MKHFIGIDVGGTNIVCGIVNEEGRLLHTIKGSTDAHLGSVSVIDKLHEMMESLLIQANMAREAIDAVGIGIPGFVDPLKGISIFAGNLQWIQVPLAQEIERRIHLPVFIDNDVRMYVYGEMICGAAAGYEHVLGITVGTGLAAAVMNRGQFYYGSGYMAGELGHITMDEIHYHCPCGKAGCLETAASANGIARQTKELIANGRPSILQEWYKDKLESITSLDVSRAYDAGDNVAIEVMERTGRLLGRGLSYAVTLFSPDLLVIGGGAALAGERLLAPMRRELQNSVYKGYWERLTIKTAELLDDAGIVGSAMLAKGKARAEL